MLDVYTAVEKPPGLRPVLVRASLHCVSSVPRFSFSFPETVRSTFMEAHGEWGPKTIYIHTKTILLPKKNG